MSDIIPLKHCPRCNEDYPATSDFFWFDKHTKDGFFNRCRKCGHDKKPREILLDGFKRCIGCEKILPANKVYFSASNYSKCRACTNAKARERTAMKSTREQLPDNMKRCSRCKLIKEASLEYFAKNTRGKNGLDSWCKPCRAEYARAGFHKNHARNILRMRKYYKENPDVFRVKAHKRRINEIEAGGSFTEKDVQAQYKSQKGKCWHCGKKLNGEYHADHLIPIARGGSNSASNIVIACKWCNLSKGDKLTQEWNGKMF